MPNPIPFEMLHRRLGYPAIDVTTPERAARFAILRMCSRESWEWAEFFGLPDVLSDDEKTRVVFGVSDGHVAPYGGFREGLYVAGSSGGDVHRKQREIIFAVDDGRYKLSCLDDGSVPDPELKHIASLVQDALASGNPPAVLPVGFTLDRI